LAAEADMREAAGEGCVHVLDEGWRIRITLCKDIELHHSQVYSLNVARFPSSALKQLICI